jgi:hypothetical protein
MMAGDLAPEDSLLSLHEAGENEPVGPGEQFVKEEAPAQDEDQRERDDQPPAHVRGLRDRQPSRRPSG